MRACCVLALLWGASGDTTGCPLSKGGGPDACREDIPLGDATSLLQARHAAAVERHQGELTPAEMTARTRRCLDDEVAAVPKGDCSLGQWSDWGACTKTCGSGTRERRRTVSSVGDGDGKCGCTAEADTCNVDPCDDKPVKPVSDCELGDWSEWSACDGGSRSRSRTAIGDCPCADPPVTETTTVAPTKPSYCNDDYGGEEVCDVATWESILVSRKMTCTDKDDWTRNRQAQGRNMNDKFLWCMCPDFCKKLDKLKADGWPQTGLVQVGSTSPVLQHCAETETCGAPQSTVCGKVKNARTDAPVEGVQVGIRQEDMLGVPVSTDASGEFCFEHPFAGDVTLTAEKEKFIKKEVTRTILDSGEGINTIFINPEGQKNDWRIVLEWGTKPIDLDAHTLVPQLCPSYGQEVYWDNKECENNGMTATLDLDHCFPDGTCKGQHKEPTPETTTLANVDPDNCRSWGCKIFFCVVNYSGSRNQDDPPVAIEDSGAVVSVSHGGEEVATYNIKDGKGYVQGGTWHAFKIHADTGKIYPCSNGNCPCGTR